MQARRFIRRSAFWIGLGIAATSVGCGTQSLEEKAKADATIQEQRSARHKEELKAARKPANSRRTGRSRGGQS